MNVIHVYSTYITYLTINCGLSHAFSQIESYIPSTIHVSIEGPIIFPNLQIWNLKEQYLPSETLRYKGQAKFDSRILVNCIEDEYFQHQK